MLLRPRPSAIQNCLQRLFELTQDHDPKNQVSAGNAWYTDDQFEKQYSRPGPRAVIENRWKIFQAEIEAYLGQIDSGNLQEPVRLFDAGCGDGINLLGLSNIIKAKRWNMRIYGADYNALRVDRASRLPFVAEIKISPLDSLPYPDGHFHVVLCNQVLEHIPQDRDVLIELKRILRPGGMLILGVPNEGCALAQLRNHVLQRSILRTTDHVNFYTSRLLSALLSNTGYAMRRVVPVGFFVPHLVLHYGLSFFALGRLLLLALGRIFPSQAAELIAIVTVDSENAVPSRL